MTRITLLHSVVHALRDPVPEARDFTPTRFTPSSTKAWFAGHMLHFLASDCPRHQFTQRFHNQLVHSFALTPHYGLRGFWTEHFATARGKAAFVEHVLRHSGSGTSNHAWRDVEREIGRRLRQSGLLDLYRQHSVGEQDAADRAELARLMAKYGQDVPAPDPGILPTVLVPVNRSALLRPVRRRDDTGQLALSSG